MPLKRQKIAFIQVTDAFGNKESLDIYLDEFHMLSYSLYGTQSRTPFSLSNMGLKTPFPNCLDDYTSVKSLVSTVKSIINNGYHKFISVETYPNRITAAPDLLEACQYILSRLSPPEGSNTNTQHILYDGSLHPTDDDKTVVDYLQEAIKKATE